MIKVFYLKLPESIKANKKGHIQLTEDWFFFINDRKIWIPKGYICDGASIPRVFWSIVGSPFDPENEIGAWAHDYLYLTHLVDKKTADEVAFQLWQQAGIGLWKARLMWKSVDLFAGFAWKNNSDDKLELIKLRTIINSRVDSNKFDKV